MSAESRTVEPSRSPAAERGREERERAKRRRSLSLRVGLLGLVTLFAGGLAIALIGFKVLPGTGLILPLVAAMVIGLLLIAAAFLLVRPSVPALIREFEP